MGKILLAAQYIKESGNQEISPALFNSASLIQTAGWNCDKYFNRYYNTRLPYPAFLSMNSKEGALFYCINKTHKFGEEIFNAYFKDPTLLQKIETDYKLLSGEINQIYSQTTNPIHTKANERQLKNTLHSVMTAMWKLNARLFFTIPLDEDLLSKLIFANKLPISASRQKLLWNTAIRFSGNSFDTRRKLYLATLIVRGLNFNQICEQVKYFYTNYNTYPTVSRIRPKILKEYKTILDKQKAKKYILLQKQLQRKTLIQFKKALTNFTRLEKNIIKFITAAIQFRDIRKDDIAKTCSVIFTISKAFLEKTSIPLPLMNYCTLPEILKGPRFLQANKAQIIKRTKGFSVLVSSSGKLSYQYSYHKNNMQILESHLLKSTSNFTNNVLQGHVAQSGSVRGSVRVITSLSSKNVPFKTGEILVTGMTRPEYIHLMKKAAAIVTDEGGITSHAAIVSRELGIPCIIGTKIATKVFKDGDMVEVDANKGTVRKINEE